MKIITVCGSLRFKDQILESGLKLGLKGNVVLSPVFSNNMNIDDFSERDLKVLREMHNEKIKLADAIYVVDVDGYIGNQTKNEIEYAKSLGKEIIYYSTDKKN